MSSSILYNYIGDGSNNRNRNRDTTEGFLTTATAVLFSTTAYFLRNVYLRKSLFYLCLKFEL